MEESAASAENPPGSGNSGRGGGHSHLEAMSEALDPSALLAHQGWVERLARGLVRDSSLAQDLAQEAWLVARAAGDEPTRGFLAGVVRNLKRNAARGARRRTAREVAAARPEALPSAAELVERAELARLLVENVLALDEHERTAILLRYFEDLSAEEIARRSGVPPGTVRARLSRGIERLRGRLKARLERRDLLAGLLVLGKESTEGGAAATTAATLLPWLGGVLAMKGLVLATGGAALLAAGLWFLTRADGERVPGVPPRPEVVNAAPLQEPPRLATEAVASVEREQVEVSPASTAAPVAPAAVEARVRLFAEMRDEQGQALDAVEVRLGEEQLGHGNTRGLVDLELPFETTVERLITLHFLRPGYTRRTEHVLLRGTSEVHLGALLLLPAATLRGRVVDGSGRPIAGAALLAAGVEDVRTDPEELRRLGPEGDVSSVHGTSASDGSFTLEGVPLGTGKLWAGHAGFSWGAQRFELGAAGLDRIELTLEPLDPLDRIAGRVLDPDGRPVPRAILHTWFMAATYGSGSEVMADEEGRFELRLEQRVVHDLTFADPEQRFSEVYRDSVEPGTLDLEVRFEEPRWLALEVRAGGKPFESFALDLDGQDGTRRRRMSVATRPEREAPFPDGRTELRVPTAPFTLRAEALGFADARTGPFAPHEAPAGLVLELQPLPGVRGRVLQADGSPATEAKVGLHQLFGPMVELEHNGFRLRHHAWPRTSTSTDAEGRFVLYPPPLGEGKFTARESVLRVTAPGHAPTELAPAVYDPQIGLELELRLLRGGVVEGAARHAPSLDPSGFLVLFHRGDGDLRTVRLGPDGQYRLEHLTPGGWWVEVLQAEMLGARSSSSSTLHDEPAPLFEPYDLEVVEGETTRHDVNLDAHAPSALRGELRLSGRSVDGWSAALFDESIGRDEIASSVALDGAGRFHLEVASPGRYVLVLSAPKETGGRLELRETLTLAPGEQDWSLELAPGRVEGSGAVDRGTRERFYRYEWRGSVAGHALSAQVRIVPEKTGAFVLPSVPPGPGVILRNDPRDGQTDFAPWETLAELEVPSGGSATALLP